LKALCRQEGLRGQELEAYNSRHELIVLRVVPIRFDELALKDFDESQISSLIGATSPHQQHWAD
jgi:hypothetical protein